MFRISCNRPRQKSFRRGLFCAFPQREGFFRASQRLPLTRELSAKLTEGEKTLGFHIASRKRKPSSLLSLRQNLRFCRLPRQREALDLRIPLAPLSGELSAKLTERLLQICNCRLPPAAPSFPSCRKRRGRKGALGGVWCFLPLNSGRNQCFGLAFHSVITSRASWCAPPATAGIKFAASCL